MAIANPKPLPEISLSSRMPR
ncbi:hypothetical protein CY0110_17777 [Crocosphaera chwakensis CCY0110]|uniref:Uncharacterized protein n=1 Tax=Crocosphaera chwakensis CCY0110 TaxID=391612 RepID=A3IIN7_9CHRO|nr:hypothetical protein CY0110_17777 [Crocosphaera chwakensis CCY0110]